MPATHPTAPTALVLSSGGLRSLVATAWVASANDAGRMVLLHVTTPSDNLPRRSQAVQRQAGQYLSAQVLEIALPKPQIVTATGKHTPADLAGATPGVGAARDGSDGGSMHRSRMLIHAMAIALDMGCRRIIWPAQFNGQFDAIAKATEQMVLIQHLAQIDHAALPEILTPLLDLTDSQVIEMGLQLQTPWTLAWSCLMGQSKPCRICQACRRRHAAFEAAGVPDPLPQQDPNEP